EISGNAHGALVTRSIIGPTTNGMGVIANGDRGVEIGGNASNNTIGGLGRSVIPYNLISGNTADGVAILDNAHNNRVFRSFIGTDVTGTLQLANGGVGVFLGGNAHDNTIGGSSPQHGNLISGNAGPGVQLNPGTHHNRVAGNRIGVSSGGTPLGNGGS